MIQILKQTPITFNGVDGWEVLIKYDEIDWQERGTCMRCIYFDEDDYIETQEPCYIVHGCGADYRTYFEFRTEPVKQ